MKVCAVSALYPHSIRIPDPRWPWDNLDSENTELSEGFSCQMKARQK